MSRAACIPFEWQGFATFCPRMTAALSDLSAASRGKMPVLLLGEQGGELWRYALALHKNAGRPAPRFVRIQCSDLDPQQLRAELGDARRLDSRCGLRRASRGTLLLEDVDGLPLESQHELLRILASVLSTPLASADCAQGPRRAAALPQVVATARASLPDLAKQGQFSADLFFRLGVFRVVIPPLSTRRCDVELVARSILAARQRTLGLADSPPELTDEALSLLRDAPLCGGEIELAAVLEQAVSRAMSGALSAEHVRDLIDLSKATLTVAVGAPLAEVECRYIDAVLRACAGNKKAAAKQLGISRRTLYLHLKRRGAPPTPAMEHDA